MAIKVRLPNGRYIKVDTNDPEYAKQRGIEYYNSGEVGFVDLRTKKMASAFDREQFDYETGVAAPWLRTKLGAMENMVGKENILQEAVGSNGFTRNSKGDLALTPDGLRTLGIEPTSSKNVIIDESSFSFNDFADFAGIYGPIVGSIAGSIITRGKIKPKFKDLKTKTIGDIGKISAGTGLGAATGKGVEEGIEYAAGLQDNTPGELASLLATEAAIGAGGEAIFGLGGKLLKYTLGQKALSRGELGRQDLINANLYASGIKDTASGKNYKGAVAIAALDSPLTGTLQGITETVTKSKTRTEALKKTLVTDLSNLVRSTNDLTEGFEKNIDDVISTGYKDAPLNLKTGEGIKKSLSKSFDETKKRLDVANSNLDKSMNGILRDFDAFELPATSEAGEQIRTATAESYAAWSDTSRELYGQVNKFFRVPATSIEAKQMIKEGVPKEFLEEGIDFIDATSLIAYAKLVKKQVIGTGKNLKPLESQKQLAGELDSIINIGSGASKKVSLEKLINLRSELGEKIRVGADGQGKFSTLDEKLRNRLYEVVDTTINNLSSGEDAGVAIIQAALIKSGREGITDNAASAKKIKAYIDSIKVANSFFAKGRQTFAQGNLSKMFRDASAGGWDTDKILNNILLKKNNGEVLNRYLNALNVETAGFKRATKEGSKIVDRSKPPLNVPLRFNVDQKKILADADIDIKNPTFTNKNDIKEVLQKEFIRTITKQIQDTGKTNYRAIANKIDSYGTTGDALFGSTQKNQLVKALRETDNLSKATSLEDFNRLLTESGNVDDVVLNLQNKLRSQLEVDDFTKINIFKQIQNGTIDTENIVTSLFKRGNADEIVKVKGLLGPESVEFKQFQDTAMRKILSDFVHPGEDTISQLFNEGKFYDAIFSPTGYGENVLKETFGEVQYKNLKDIATRFKFAAGGEGSTAGNLMTTNIAFKMALAPIQAIGTFSPLRIVSELLARPTIIRLLVGKTPPGAFIKNDLPSLLDAYGVTRTAIATPISITARQAPLRGIQEMREETDRIGIDPKAPIASTSLELPEVQQTQTNFQNNLEPISRTLLGGSFANEDIARRLRSFD